MESFQGSIDGLEKRIHRLEQKYNELAKDLSIKRIEAAKKLDYDMERQLPALKLDQATFKTTIEKVKSGDYIIKIIDKNVDMFDLKPGNSIILSESGYEKV